MPFAGYKNFDDCVRKNKDKGDPKAYCATIMRKVEKEAMSVGGFKSPEPGKLSDKGKEILAKAYASCRKNYPNYSKERCSKIAWGAVKNAGFKECVECSIPDIKENVPITYMIPVQWETIKEGKINEAYVKGVAISATTSRNNVSYIVEELEKSYPSLNGKNIAVGHDEDPSNNVGLIESVNFDGNNVNYFAKIYNTYKHPDGVEMVKKKLWQYVSIEAIVSKLIKEEDKFIAQGINFTGLSFVRTPGVENATANFSADESFAQAIAEGYTLKTKTEEKIMAEEKIKEELEEEPAEEETEEKVDTSKLIAEGVKKELEKIQEAERVKKLEEENKKLKVQLEEKAKSEAVVSDSIVKEPETNLIFEKYGGETSFWVMPESDGKIRRAS